MAEQHYTYDICRILNIPTTDTNREQVNVVCQALDLFVNRNAVHRDLWKQYGARDNLLHMRSKLSRLIVQMTSGDTAQAVEEAYDLINYSVFFIRNLMEGNVSDTQAGMEAPVESGPDTNDRRSLDESHLEGSEGPCSGGSIEVAFHRTSSSPEDSGPRHDRGNDGRIEEVATIRFYLDGRVIMNGEVGPVFNWIRGIANP